MVGLGNPGRRYAGTRHNAGFMVVEALGRRWRAEQPRSAFGGLLYDVRLGAPAVAAARRVMMLMPQTYMNRSGQAVRELTAFYKAAPDELLVVLDDMALPAGRLRARAQGSAGGHNGLADVLQALGTTAVPRLRVGIGQPTGGEDAVGFVLSPFGSDEAEVIEQAVEAAADAVADWVVHGMTFVMDRYNRKPGE